MEEISHDIRGEVLSNNNMEKNEVTKKVKKEDAWLDKIISRRLDLMIILWSEVAENIIMRAWREHTVHSQT